MCFHCAGQSPDLSLIVDILDCFIKLPAMVSYGLDFVPLWQPVEQHPCCVYGKELLSKMQVIFAQSPLSGNPKNIFRLSEKAGTQKLSLLVT
jgi:hypothetical protein